MESLKLRYFGLIHSNIICCNSVWSSCCEINLLLLDVQRKFIIRSTVEVSRCSHIEPTDINLSLHPLSLIYQYTVAFFVYRCLKDEFFVLSGFRLLHRFVQLGSLEDFFSIFRSRAIEISNQGDEIWNRFVTLNLKS